MIALYNSRRSASAVDSRQRSAYAVLGCVVSDFTATASLLTPLMGCSGAAECLRCRFAPCSTPFRSVSSCLNLIGRGFRSSRSLRSALERFFFDRKDALQSLPLNMNLTIESKPKGCRGRPESPLRTPDVSSAIYIREAPFICRRNPWKINADNRF